MNSHLETQAGIILEITTSASCPLKAVGLLQVCLRYPIYQLFLHEFRSGEALPSRTSLRGQGLPAVLQQNTLLETQLPFQHPLPTGLAGLWAS